MYVFLFLCCFFSVSEGGRPTLHRRLDGCPKGHIGEHTKFIVGLRGPQSFTQLIEKFKMNFEPLFNTRKLAGTDTYRICVFCKAGIHRSVGIARHLASISEELGFKVQIQHLDRDKWAQRRLCMGKCTPCGPTREKTEALAASWRLFCEC